ncbi:pyridoxal phosphate homeostasis protein [Agrilus planipennis]|uniref:Pyridoxal phosphate homeostasis protein n=1 Tax=Agrilus planipennis TaxID=224129 RepID=A0A1W4XP89_AGRPL|nr:pyridoxal phosphate homeostasis protein [Agrilus planipennis]
MQRIMTEVDVKLNLRKVWTQIEKAYERTPADLRSIKPGLVCASKTKPPDLIIQAYEEGQRDFGENYVDELVTKANNADILAKCKQIRWHFIGHLQTNKINKVLSIPNLYVIETIDSEKLATSVNNRWSQHRHSDCKLPIMIQINTSGEEEKEGVEPKDAVKLAKYVVDNCENLQLIGLMTIGMFGYDYLKNGPNPDFLCLFKCREDISIALGLDKKQLHLSMGMSNDFEHAIELGSTNVRVGTTIFGERLKKN